MQSRFEYILALCFAERQSSVDAIQDDRYTGVAYREDERDSCIFFLLYALAGGTQHCISQRVATEEQSSII